MIKGMLAILFVATTAVAQQITAVNAQTSQQSASVRGNNPLIAVLDIDLTDVTIKTALDEVSARSGIPLVYSHTVVPMNRRVTVRGQGITLNAALKQILKGTGTESKVTAEGQVTIGRVSPNQIVKAQGVVSGKVTDAKTGKGISGANISIDDARGVATNDDGVYRLGGIVAGNHSISVRMLGYAKQSRQVTVGDGATAIADFKLENSASVLDQVIVTGTIAQTELKAVPNAMTVITAKDLESRNITSIDQLFRGDIPGIFATQSGALGAQSFGTVQMFSRGATKLESEPGVQFGATNAIKTFVDGVELADPKYLSQIDPANIERIEIVNGPQASTMYGSNSINGVMQIFTKRGISQYPKLALSLQSGVTQNNLNSALAPQHDVTAQLEGIEKRLSYNTGGAWRYTGDWTPARHVTAISGFGSVRADLGALTTTLSMRRSLGRNEATGPSEQVGLVYQQLGIVSPSNNWQIAGRTVQEINTQTAGVTLGYTPMSWWSNEIVLGNDLIGSQTVKDQPSYRTEFDTARSYFNSTTTRQSQRYVTTARNSFGSFATTTLTLGGDHWTARGNTVQADPIITLTGTLANPTISRQRPENNSGVFAQGQLGFRDALFFTYGIRAEWNPNFGDDAQVLPGRYGISYIRDIGALTAKVRGSYGRSTRSPALGQKNGQPVTAPNSIRLFGPYYVTIPNPDLGPEFQQGGEGGIELYFGARGSLVVTRYNQTVAGLISYVPSVDSARTLLPLVQSGLNPANFPQWTDGYGYTQQGQTLNIGDIRNQGWETQGTINVGPLSTRGTYSWTKSRMIGITERYRSKLDRVGYKPGYSFNLIAEHTWALNLSYAHSASKVSLTLNGIGQNLRSVDDVRYAVQTAYRNDSDRPRTVLPDTYRGIGQQYVTADLNSSHRFSQKVEALLNIRNLSDYYRNDVNPGFPVMGRQIEMGMRIRP